MREEVNRLLAMYSVDTSDACIINGLLKKYAIDVDDEQNASRTYIFSETESAMTIPKQKKYSCLFPPDITEKDQNSILEKIFHGKELDKLESHILKFGGDMEKLALNLITRIRGAEEKIKKKLENSDSDSVSDICTKLFLNEIRRDLVKVVEPCLKNQAKEYQKLGKLLTKYLKAIGFYTPNEINTENVNDYISFRDSYIMLTNDLSMRGWIESLCSMPYLIDYYDAETEEISTYLIKGICYYYKMR